MIVSIHQPSYFPWLGMLDKIRKSDLFVLMDEIQLSDSGFQHRNLFLTSDGKPKFLTIPFVKKDYLQRPFRRIEIASSEWKTKHFDFIRNSYRRHAHAAEVMPRLEAFYAADYPLLIDAVSASMRMSFEFFAIDTRVTLQSSMDYDRSLRRAELVLALVRASGATCYLSGVGAKAYLNESAFFGNLTLRYNVYRELSYPQKGVPEFKPGLSCLDLLFNVGLENARALLNADRVPASS